MQRPSNPILRNFIPVLGLLVSAHGIASTSHRDNINPGTVLFKIDSDASPNQLKSLNALLKGQGLVERKTLDGTQITIATFEHDGREKAIANIIKRSGYVEFAEPDYAIPPSVQPNDPSYLNQWHHQTINSEQAWSVTTGDNRVLVAVCDSGFDVEHPDLRNNLRTDLAYNAHDGSTYIFDANGHGTGTAGTLGAVGNNAAGVAGVNWNVDIIPVRIAISDSNSSAYISTMAKCIEYAADNGARIVNLSYQGVQFASIDSAAQYLRARDGLLFMSAGNDGQEFTNYPDYPSFIAVGATGQSNTKASFSSWGSYVDLTAPGVSIRTTYPNNRYISYSGTSFSSPVAAGVAALMVAANPSITVSEIENGLFTTAVDIGETGDDNLYGHGLVDAHAAVSYAVNAANAIAPHAQIQTSRTTVLFGEPIDFSGQLSSDADGNIDSYDWQLGDGTRSVLAELTHTYTQAGMFQVSLTVTDNDGLVGSTTTWVEVSNAVPVAVIENMATQYNVGDLVRFSGAGSYDNDGSIVSYEWHFSNGQTAQGVSVEQIFNVGGRYTVTLTITDNAGAISTDTVEVVIADPNTLNAPSQLSAQITGSNVALNWLDNSTNELNFVVERGEKVRGKVRYQPIAELAADSTQFTETVGAGNYLYRVKAVNSAQEAISETVKVTVDSTPPSPGPGPGDLQAPSNLSVALTNNLIQLNWTDNSADELGFYIELGEKSKGSIDYSRVAAVAGNVSNFEWSPSTLPRGNYSYRVQAYKDGEVSSYSNTAEFRIK